MKNSSCLIPATRRLAILSAGIASLLTGFGIPSANAGTTIDWNDAGTVWGTGTNWVLGTAPADDFTVTGDIAQFNLATYTNQPNVSAAARGVRGIIIGATSGATLTITAGTSTTGLSIGDSGIDMSAAGANLTLGAGTTQVFTVGANQIWSVASGRILTVAGKAQINNTLNLTGPGEIAFNTASTGTGAVTLTSGTARFTTTSATLGTGSLTVNAGTIATTANDFTLGNSSYAFNGDFGITGGGAGKNFKFNTGAITLGGGVGITRTVTLTSSGIALFAGAIGDGGNGNGFTKAGSMSLILTGAQTYTGTTTITGGTLYLGGSTGAGSVSGTSATGSLSTSSAIVLGGGTLSFGRSTAVVQGTDFSGSAITGTGGFEHRGTTDLTLNVANTFSGGATTVSGSGNLILTNALAVQNSTLTRSSTGNIVFSNSAGTAWTVGGLGGASNISLLTDTSAAIALTINGNGSAGTMSGAISGTGATITKRVYRKSELWRL